MFTVLIKARAAVQKAFCVPYAIQVLGLERLSPQGAGSITPGSAHAQIGPICLQTE